METSGFLTGNFDLVISDQVIEHVQNPLQMLKNIRKALVENGVLSLATPNFGGASFNLLADSWKNTAPGDHISMFTPRVLENYLVTAGFKVLDWWIGGCSMYQRRNRYDEYSAVFSQDFQDFFKTLTQQIEQSQFGDAMHFICQKVSKAKL